MEFVGRKAELAALNRHLDRVRSSGRGVLLSMRGRRQVGKSALVEHFTAHAGVSTAFFVATRSVDPATELRSFVATVAQSDLQVASTLARAEPRDWAAALSLVAESTTQPTILVIDEFPYLLAEAPGLEGVLQTVWDRTLSRVPLLLIVIGSAVSTMEVLGAHARPLYGRMHEMVVEPFTVAETGDMIGAEPATAMDAQLIIGGYPRLAAEWQTGQSPGSFLREQLSESTSPLVVVGERMLTAEFPPDLQAGRVLRAVGAGSRTFAGLRERTGVHQSSLARTIATLGEHSGVLAINRPLSARRSRHARYEIRDPYLRFWLRFIGPNLELLLRRRGEAVGEQVLRDWPTYRGMAVESLVRASLEHLLPSDRFASSLFVGSYWTRDGSVEVDLVGTDTPHAPAAIGFVGSIKWREPAPFDGDDLRAVATQRALVPGAEDAALVGVSRSGFTTNELDAALGPEDLVAAWR